MTWQRNKLISTISISFCLLIILDILLGNFLGLSFIVAGWASMTVFTSALFILLFSTNFVLTHPRRLHLFYLIGFLAVINFLLALFLHEQPELSSLATSALFIILSVHGHFLVNESKAFFRFIIELFVYSISNIVLIYYFLEPAILYDIPGFETVSWNTAIGFLLYSSTLLSTYYKNLITANDIPTDLTFFNKRFVDHFFSASFYSPVCIIFTISLLHFFGVFTMKTGMAVGLLIVSIIPFPLTYIIFDKTFEWNKSLYEKNKQLLDREQDVKFHNELLQEFAQITSHNLRGPIVGLNNLISLLRNEDISEEDKVMSLELLYDRIGSLTGSVDNLAEFYNMIRDGQIAYDHCTVEEHFDKAIKSCLSTHLLTEKDVIVEYDLQQSSIEYPFIYMENMAYNLVSNSFKYRDTSRILTIKITTESAVTSSTTLTYWDNGIGMNLKYFRNKIFKFGTSYHNYNSSNGMGLFILYCQLARLGDTIDVDSKEGEFTEFVLRLNQHGKKDLGYS